MDKDSNNNNKTRTKPKIAVNIPTYNRNPSTGRGMVAGAKVMEIEGANGEVEENPHRSALSSSGGVEDSNNPGAATTSSPAFTRSKRKRREAEQESATASHSEADGSKRAKTLSDKSSKQSSPLQQPPADFANAYVELCNHMIFSHVPPETQQLLQGLNLPGDALSGLGYLKHLRPPTVLEQWSPYEIAVFQAAVAHHGKRFDLIQKELAALSAQRQSNIHGTINKGVTNNSDGTGAKTTQQVIDFYLVWKKTKAYQKWKQEYLPPHLDTDDEDETLLLQRQEQQQKEKSKPKAK